MVTLEQTLSVAMQAFEKRFQDMVRELQVELQREDRSLAEIQEVIAEHVVMADEERARILSAVEAAWRDLCEPTLH